MIAYFKKYTIYIGILAIALPVIASTIYPMITGQLIMSTLGGLIASFVLFAMGLLIGYGIFERKAQDKVNSWIDLYNHDCDPIAFMDASKELYSQMRFPCNAIAAWFLGTYGQACLDAGNSGEAKQIAAGLVESFNAASKQMEKVGILANMLPLIYKVDGAEDALGYIGKGLEITAEDPSAKLNQFRDYFNSEKRILESRVSGNSQERISLDEGIVSNDQYPMRLRVEFAWDAASAEYRLGDKAAEDKYLSFVIEHGNKLAMVASAKDMSR